MQPSSGMKLLRYLALVLACFGLSCATPQKTDRPPSRLRVLSYNIHHGEGTDGRIDLPRIAAIIRNAEADLVALQEVDDRTTRANGVNQAAELGRLTGLKAIFGQAMPFQGGGYGQAILSRWPAEQWSVHNLPQRSGREPRIMVRATLKVGERGPEIGFASTHLDHEVESIRVQQAAALNAILVTNALRTVLAGDFNAVPETPVMSIFSTNWVDAALPAAQPTIPSNEPRRRIDYILLKPRDAWRVIETRVLEEPVASDHRPVLTVIELIEP